MAASLNKVMLIGNIGKDPEIRMTNDGRKIASLVLATSVSYRDKSTDEKKEKTEWHRLAIFSEPLVNVVENYVKKGSKIFVEGALQTRKWVDNSGQERYTTEVVLQNYNSSLTLLDSKGSDIGDDNQSHSGQYQKQDYTRNSNTKNNPELNLDELDDEIPF